MQEIWHAVLPFKGHWLIAHTHEPALHWGCFGGRVGPDTPEPKGCSAVPLTVAMGDEDRGSSREDGFVAPTPRAAHA
jgi:hypothetical protein